ncbi:MAG: MBL fold metallo-hydrolase [Ignavibacteria bacterium]|nr:MBL fold metallo-hydrolase [Ignavibacteria bacterium]
MKITVLGSGTSQGVPVIGCKCKTCTSENIKDKRLRASVYVETGDSKILIDTSIDFRRQMLDNNKTDVDAVLFTHHHADHIFGMDDLRQINQRLNKYIDVYGRKDTLDEILKTFRYITDKELIMHKCVPLINLKIIENKKFYFRKTGITPVEVLHGRIKIFGYRIGNFAYLTDCSFIPEEEYVKFDNLDLLIINALRLRPHPTHFNLEQAVGIAELFKPKQTYLTHITHDLMHNEINSELPENIQLAYDGLEISLKD